MISTAYIRCSYNANDKTLDVRASEYTYTAANGAVVSWRPVSVTLGEREATLTKDGDYYVASFTSVTQSDGQSVSVSYISEFFIPSSALSAALSQTLGDVEALKDKLARYESAKEKYEEDTVKYEEYLDALSEYNASYALYLEYLSEKRKHEDALGSYNRYLAELEAYNKAVDDYNNYEENLEKYKTDYAR